MKKKKYKVTWSETLFYENEVKAKDEEEAIEVFKGLDIDDLNVVDSQGGDDIEVEEIKE